LTDIKPKTKHIIHTSTVCAVGTFIFSGMKCWSK